MYSVYLAFSKDCPEPEPEDKAVKAYLAEHELVPKWHGTDVLDGREFEVLLFGGCYLGRHLQAIEEIQRESVTQELLAEEGKPSVL